MNKDGIVGVFVQLLLSLPPNIPEVVIIKELPTTTSAIPVQKEWYCSYVNPSFSANGDGTFHNPPHDPFGGTKLVNVLSNAKCDIPAAINAVDNLYSV